MFCSHDVMAVKLSPLEEKLLKELSIQDLKRVAKLLRMSEGTINVHLYRIRKKYKQARSFTSLIDSYRNKNPNLQKYLKTRETK